MRDWMQVAKQLETEGETEDNRDNRDKSPSKSPIVPNVPIVLASASPADQAWRKTLPPHLLSALDRLASVPPPISINSKAAWRAAVADAIWLAESGHAAAALGLGWTTHQLWGWNPRAAADDCMDYAGLAIQLMGRRMLLLERDKAIIGRDASRSFFYPAEVNGRALLWEPVK